MNITTIFNLIEIILKYKRINKYPMKIDNLSIVRNTNNNNNNTEVVLARCSCLCYFSLGRRYGGFLL